ncbi:MAG: 50S ribosomal protein L3 [Verrucomicrobiales bacterium]|nr:50S ribosomal protein L3 [Verrucomicrobiales bacterium]HQW29108.1 50S ribosomal protein L3 [Verrucomicrobiales bacterium]
MSIGLIGKKVGMTRIFNEEGVAVAVTVIDISDNIFLQKKTSEKDGYTAVQVGYGDQKESRLNRAELGHLKANGGTPKRKVLEFRLENDDQLPEVSHPGLDLFDVGQWVDVIGTSKGKGFQGVMRRHNFHGQPQAHGHMMHRRTGGVGAGTDPGRIWKGKAMPGRQGNDRKTIQNLQIVQKRPEDNVILVSGAVPGARGGYVVIRPAKKKEGPVRNLKAGANAAAEAAPAEESSES